MSTSEIIGLAKFHPKLAKKVKLAASTCPCDWSEDLPENFVKTLPKFARHVEEFEVKINSSFLPGLHKVWQARRYRFQNLTKISIIICASYDENEFTIVTETYPKMENVKEISFTMADQYLPDQDDMAASICQKLLNAAPNVAEVEVKASFYLDFSPSKKLAKFSYTFVKFLDVETDEPVSFMDMDRVTEMLATCCGESLAELKLSHVAELNGDEEDDDGDIPEILSLPSLPSLTRLSLSAMEAYRLGDCLHMTNLPNLTHVTLVPSNKQYITLSDMFEHFRQPHVGITSLDLSAMYDGDEDNVTTAAKIVRLFPAVTKFQLKLTNLQSEDDDDDDDMDSGLTDTLRNFAAWELTSALVEMKNVESSGDVLATTKGLMGWKSLAHTEVRLCAAAGTIFIPGDAVKAVLLTCKAVKLVKMSGFVIKGKNKFQGFIEANHLPITLSE
ncbi:uncharacterized protein LOC118437355 [Folsomia candida]|uniref:uncharacterized protein LOC118437355 n=1 Tax=Folsomia candida TaxID=158441 RepID=UPI001605270E|nr:uncharacterized protein LOC118437355 [Folsomia candida]